MKVLFRYQIWHWLFLLFIIVLLQTSFFDEQNIVRGALWGVSTKTWFRIAIVTPILHQVYVWLIWRLELHKNTFTKRFGLTKSFKIYAAGFSFLFVGRLISIIILALSNRNSLLINPYFAYLSAAVITPMVIYLFYSVKRYFTIKRAFGIDHFAKEYNEPYVKRGIFRFSKNAMYVYGMMILYLPGLLLLSKAALAVALFNHIYIWVHYYCTEQPDMKIIYDK